MVFTVYFIIFIFQDGAGLETLCSAVRELIHSCGDELGWCFTEDQVPFDVLIGVLAIFDFYFGDESKGWCFNEDQVAFLSQFSSLKIR